MQRISRGAEGQRCRDAEVEAVQVKLLVQRCRCRWRCRYYGGAEEVLRWCKEGRSSTEEEEQRCSSGVGAGAGAGADTMEVLRRCRGGTKKVAVQRRRYYRGAEQVQRFSGTEMQVQRCRGADDVQRCSGAGAEEVQGRR